MLEVRARRSGRVVVLELAGTIDIDSSLFIEKVAAALSDGYRDLLCDLSEVSYVDYSGLSALAIAYKNVVNHKGRMKFFGVPVQVMKTLSLVCLDKVFEIFPDEKSALKSLGDETRITEIQKKQLRRRFKRLALDIALEFRALGESGFHSGKVLNLSGIGLLVSSEQRYETGEMLELKLSLPPVSEALAVRAKVVWLVRKELQPQLYPGMGLAFHAIAPDVQEKIIAYIDRNVSLDSAP